MAYPVTTVRRRAIALVRSLAAGGAGDPSFAHDVPGWRRAEPATGLLAHWLLHRLGCADPALVNRDDPERGLTRVPGRDVARLYARGRPPFVRWAPGAGPAPGDIVLARGTTGADHVLVLLDARFTSDGTVWAMAESVVTGGTPRVRLGPRRPVVTSSALLLAGVGPAPRVMGWVDLDLTALGT